MTLGILGGMHARRSMGSLGAEVANWPPPKWWCWKAAGYPWGAAFDACHSANYQKCVARGLWPGTKDGDNCVNAYDLNCGCPTSEPTTRPAGAAASSSGALVMGNKTSDPRVVELQKKINEALVGKGYAAIGTDGKLGPGTCGAAREADKFGAGLMAQYGLTGACTSFTAPTKTGGFSPSPLGPGAPLEPVSEAGFLGMDSSTLLFVGLGLGAMFLMSKKKKNAGAK